MAFYHLYNDRWRIDIVFFFCFLNNNYDLNNSLGIESCHVMSEQLVFPAPPKIMGNILGILSLFSGIQKLIELRFRFSFAVFVVAAAVVVVGLFIVF